MEIKCKLGMFYGCNFITFSCDDNMANFGGEKHVNIDQPKKIIGAALRKI